MMKINLLSSARVKKRKEQKEQIKEELLPIVWHPSRWWEWCVREEEKKETENFFLTI